MDSNGEERSVIETELQAHSLVSVKSESDDMSRRENEVDLQSEEASPSSYYMSWFSGSGKDVLQYFERKSRKE